MWITPSSTEMTTLVALMRPEIRQRATQPAQESSASLSLSTRNEAKRRYRSDLSAWAELADKLDKELRGHADSDAPRLARSTGSVVLGGSSNDNASIALAELPDAPLGSSGSLRLNGVDILIASSVDTVDSLITRINDSGSGVSASLNRQGELELSSEESFQISGDTALLTGLGLTQSWVSPSPDSSLLERLKSPEVQSMLKRLGDGMARLVNPSRHNTLDPLEHSQSLARIALRLRDGIRDNLEANFDPLQMPSFDSGLGLSFKFRGESLWQWQSDTFNQQDASSQQSLGKLLSEGIGPQGWSLLRGVRAAVLGEAERYGGAELLV